MEERRKKEKADNRNAETKIIKNQEKRERNTSRPETHLTQEKKKKGNGSNDGDIDDDGLLL